MGRYRVLEKHTPHFITSTIQNWEPVFMDPNIAQILLDALAFLQEQKRLTLYAYVIMENHTHLVANAPELSREIGALKSFTARRILDYLQENKLGRSPRTRAVKGALRYPMAICADTRWLRAVFNMKIVRSHRVSYERRWR